MLYSPALFGPLPGNSELFKQKHYDALVGAGVPNGRLWVELEPSRNELFAHTRQARGLIPANPKDPRFRIGNKLQPSRTPISRTAAMAFSLADR